MCLLYKQDICPKKGPSVENSQSVLLYRLHIMQLKFKFHELVKRGIIHKFKQYCLKHLKLLI